MTDLGENQPTKNFIKASLESYKIGVIIAFSPFFEVRLGKLTNPLDKISYFVYYLWVTDAFSCKNIPFPLNQFIHHNITPKLQKFPLQ